MTIALLASATLCPVLAAVAFYQLERTTRFGKLGWWTRQVIIGLVFGGIAICGTEFGIPLEGATANVRDAPPIIAGLLFGGPAGILAGVLGGVERWFAALWGRGMFTRVACSVATVAAGLYAALLRSKMFDEKKPTWPFALAIGVVAEVLHLTLVFVTNMDNVQGAFEVVRACYAPMIMCNGLSVCLATVALTLLSGERFRTDPANREISRSVQNGMLICTLVAFVVTTSFTFVLQTSLFSAHTTELLELNIADVKADIEDIATIAPSDAERDEWVGGVTHNVHVGRDGSVLVADGQGRLVSSHSLLDADSTLESLGLAPDIETTQEGVLFETSLRGTPEYAMWQEVAGYVVVAFEPVEEARFERDVAVLVGAFMVVIVFAALYTVIYFLIKHLVVDNIHEVNGTLAKITDGNLDASVEVRSNREFASLSDDINTTVAALKRAIGEAAARIDAELEYARTIQRSILPQVFAFYPPREDVKVFASMDPAKEVGGDFYDFYLLDDSHLVILIADVSGKGIPAALFMMRSKTLLKSLTEAGVPVQDVFTHANDELCEGNNGEMFVTAWMGVIDLATGHMEFANAGHNPAALAHAGGKFELVFVHPNLVLAGMEGVSYRLHELDLMPGDTLYIYTDGVTEATDAHDELFGDDRLLASLDSHVAGGVEALCRGVHADVDAFVGDAPQFDDMTMLALTYLGGK